MSDLIKVYRVEKEVNGQAYGPFTAHVYEKTEASERAFMLYTRDIPGCPNTPREDGCEIFIEGVMLSGCIDLYQLDAWGTMAIREHLLNDEAGFSLAVYEVPSEHLYIGETQAVWDPQYSKKIGTTTFQDILEEEFS